jgi:phosphoinositide-3-kinase, regulatory subunit 4
VANLHEHKASVNEIQVSRDNQFFATASDDGTVKIWDCQRLEKSVTNRSRLTYSQGGRISSIAILENSHSVVSGSDNGSLHVYRVDLMPAARMDATSLTTYVPRLVPCAW